MGQQTLENWGGAQQNVIVQEKIEPSIKADSELMDNLLKGYMVEFSESRIEAQGSGSFKVSQGATRNLIQIQLSQNATWDAASGVQLRQQLRSMLNMPDTIRKQN